MFEKNTRFLILFNKRFFSSSFGQINSYKSLFLVTKRFRFFKLIDNRRFLKKNRMFKLKSNYNPRLRIRFISGIRYFGFPISISRFNMLRFFVSKNYRLRVRVGELSGWLNRFLSNILSNNRYSLRCRLKRELKITKISSNIFNFFFGFRLLALKTKKLNSSGFGTFHSDYAFKRGCNNSLDNSGSFWFTILNRFYNFNVFNFYLNFLVKKVFIPLDRLRFLQQIQFKWRVNPKRREQQQSAVLLDKRKSYLNDFLIDKYNPLFFRLFFSGFSFSLLRQVFVKSYWIFSSNWSQARFFSESKLFSRFLNSYKFINYFKYKRFYARRVRLLVKRILLSRQKIRITKKLIHFLRKLDYKKKYLLPILKKILFVRCNLFSFGLVFKNAKQLLKNAITKKKKYLLKYFSTKFNNTKTKKLSCTKFLNKTRDVKFNVNLEAKYLFNVISSNVRLARFSAILNGIDSRLSILSSSITPSCLFPHWEILTKKYLKTSNIFKHNRLLLNHLRFLSNYYKFYSFNSFLAPLVDQVYYSLVSAKHSDTLFNNTKLNKDVITKQGIEHYFKNCPTSPLLQQRVTDFNSEAPVELTLSRLASNSNFKNSKFFNLNLVGILLFTLISSGRKKKAVRILNSLFGLMKFKYQSTYLGEYARFLMSLRPILRYRSIYIGGKKYKIPLLLTSDRGYSLATRWYVNNSVGKSVNELFENFNKTLSNQGNLLKIRREYHLLSFENKIYIRFLRFFKQGF